MAGGKSIFGKVAAVFAGLSGAAAPAQAGAPDSAPQQPAAITAEQELRSLRLVVREAGTAARRNQILSERGATSDDSVFAAPLAEAVPWGLGVQFMWGASAKGKHAGSSWSEETGCHVAKSAGAAVVVDAELG